MCVLGGKAPIRVTHPEYGRYVHNQLARSPSAETSHEFLRAANFPRGVLDKSGLEFGGLCTKSVISGISTDSHSVLLAVHALGMLSMPL